MFSQAPPLFTLGKIPVNVTGLIILIEILGMLAVVFSGGAALSAFGFKTSGFLSGQLWTLFTYPLFAPVGIGFIIGIFFFYQFGGMVEGALGQKNYALLCGAVVMTAPLVLIILSFLGLGAKSYLIGSSLIHLSVFSAFCVMYPNLPSFFGLQIKWFGLVFFIISLLSYIQEGAFASALACLASVALALIMVQNKGLALIKVFPDSLAASSPKISKKRPKAKSAKRVAKAKIKPKPIIPADTDIDVLLDKISAEGLHSLTPEERKRLEKGS